MENEDQMDRGSAGRMRGQGHVRIPQRRVAQSLRSGVSPSMMNQPTGRDGQFQGASPGRNYFPIRSQKPARSSMFQRFMQKSGGTNQHMPQPHTPQPPRPPMGRDGGHGLPQFPHSGGGGHGGGREIRPPVIGHGQSPAAMVAAMMGDIGQGFNADQYQNMLAGHMPGQENGDFWNAMGTSNAHHNQDPLQALAQFLTQGADGTYSMDPSHMQAIQQLLMQATQANHAPQNPIFQPMPGMGGQGGRPGFPQPPVPPWMQGGRPQFGQFPPRGRNPYIPLMPAQGMGMMGR